MGNPWSPNGSRIPIKLGSYLLSQIIPTYFPTDEYNSWNYVFFLDGSSGTSLETDIKSVAVLLGWSNTHLQSGDLLVRFLQWQRENDKWLIVVENSGPGVVLLDRESTNQFPDYICRKDHSDGGLVLIVQESVPNSVQDLGSVSINEMTVSEASRLFCMGLRGDPIPDRDVVKVVEAVGCHPLTIEGVLGYLDGNKISNQSAQLFKFLQGLKDPMGSSSATKALSRSFAVLGEVFKKLEVLAGDSASGDKAFNAKAALQIMELLVLGDRNGFEERILRLSWEKIRRSRFSSWRTVRHLEPFRSSTESGADYAVIEEALTTLHDHHLVNWNGEERVVEIHPVVRLTARKRGSKLASTSGPKPWEILLITLAEALPWDPLSVECIQGNNPWKDRWIIHGHLMSSLNNDETKQWLTGPGEALLDRAELGLKISIAVGESGQLEIASELQKGICYSLGKILSDAGSSSKDTVILYYRAKNELSISLMGLGLSEGAFKIQKEICEEISTQNIEFNVDDIAAWKANLAQSYVDLRNTEAALRLREEILKIHLGKEGRTASDLPTIQAHLDLGNSLESVGRTPEALYHRQVALAKFTGTEMTQWTSSFPQEVLNTTEFPSKLETALIRSIAKSYHQFGRYLEALELREKLLEHQRNILHDTDADLLESYTELAETKNRLGISVIDIRMHVYNKTREIFGTEHSRTVTARLLLDETKVRDDELSCSGLEDIQQLRTQLEGRYPLNDPRVLYIKDRMAQLKEQGSDNDVAEALELQRNIFAARSAGGSRFDYDTLLSQCRVGDCLFRLHQHVDALNLRQDALEQQRELLVAYVPGTRDLQTHPLILSTRASLARNYFTLADPLCSCFEPGDTCNNILPTPEPLSLSSVSSTSDPLAQVGPLSFDRSLMDQEMNYQEEVDSVRSDSSYNPLRTMPPLDGRHIEMERADIDARKQNMLGMAIQEARAVLKERIEIFSKKHKLTIQSMETLAEMLDFDDSVAHAREVKDLEEETRALKAEMSGLDVSLAHVRRGRHSHPQTEWLGDAKAVPDSPAGEIGEYSTAVRARRRRYSEI